MIARIVTVYLPRTRRGLVVATVCDSRLAGLSAVAQKLSFKLSAPATLAGLPRHEVRLVQSHDGSSGALVTYGEGDGTGEEQDTQTSGTGDER